MAELQLLFEQAQEGFFVRRMHMPPRNGRRAHDSSTMTEQEMRLRYERELAEYTAARAKIDAFLTAAEPAFGKEIPEYIMKALETLRVED